MSGVTVVLNGQGADETTAGYPSYFKNYWVSLLGSAKVRHSWNEIGDYEKVFRGHRPTLFLESIASLGWSQLRRSSLYRRLADARRLRRGVFRSWFSQDLLDHLRLEKSSFIGLSLDACLRHSMSVSPLPLYLRVEDRNTMAHGIEARLPFLDFRLASFVFSLTDDWKMKGPWNKFILRQAMRDLIPESVRTRKEKMGFPSPISTWIADPLYDVSVALLSDPTTRQRGVFNVDKILDCLRAHREGTIDVSAQLFNVLQFEVWMREVVEKRPLVDAPDEAVSQSDNH